MAQLKIDVIVDDHGAAQQLNKVEQGVKGVESAAGTSTAAVQKHSAAMSSWSATAGSFIRQAGAMYVALGADRLVGALAEAASEAFRSAGALTDLSAKSGLTVSALQRLDYVGTASGVSMENFADAAYKLQIRLGEGKDKGLLRTVSELGLNFEALRAMSPDQQFNAVISALSKVESEQRRNQMGNELFGKSFAGIAAGITRDYDAIAAAAQTSGDAQIKALDDTADAWDLWVKNRKNDITGYLGSLILVSSELQKMSLLSTDGGRADFAKFAASGKTLDQYLKDKATNGGSDITLPASGVPGYKPPKTQAQLDAEEREAERLAKQAAAAAKAIAEATKKRRDQLSGQADIDFARQMMEDVHSDPRGLMALSQKDLQKYNDALEAAADALQRQGKAITTSDPIFQDWLKSLNMHAVRGLDSFADPSGKLKLGQSVTPPGATSYYGNLLPQAVQGLPGGLPGTSADLSNINPLKDVGFFQQAFGTGKQLGAQLGQAILGGIQGGWKGIVGNIGSMLGGNIGSQLGGMLSKMGGFLGGLGGMLGPLGSMLGGLAGDLVGKLFGPSEYEKRVRSEQEQRDELKSSLNMPELQRQADFTGRQDLLTGVTSGLATKNDPEYLRGLVTDLNQQTQQLTAAMDRYGISWEQLGEKARQSQINQMAEQFVADFNVLTAAGADVNLVIEKMGSSVNEFVQTAIRTGTEVPMAMQPMMQRMVDMGLLTDASGEKLKDLGGITFSETLTQGIDRIVTAVDHLAAALGYKLPAAAEVAANGMNAAFSRVRPPSMMSRDDAQAWLDNPPDRDFTAMASTNASSGFSGGGGVTVYVDASGSLVHSDALSEQIAESVAPFLPRAVENYGI